MPSRDLWDLLYCVEEAVDRLKETFFYYYDKLGETAYEKIGLVFDKEGPYTTVSKGPYELFVFDEDGNLEVIDLIESLKMLIELENKLDWGDL